MALLSCISGSQLKALYFTQNSQQTILSFMKMYWRDLIIYSTIEDFNKNEALKPAYFFHSDDQVIPKICGIGSAVNIYFYKNNNQELIFEDGIKDNLSS